MHDQEGDLAFLIANTAGVLAHSFPPFIPYTHNFLMEETGY